MLIPTVLLALGNGASASMLRQPQVHIDAGDAHMPLAGGVLLSAKSNQTPTTTENPFRQGASAAEMSGVQTNGTGDLAIFLTGLATNSFMCIAFFLTFSVLRQKIPIVYAGNVVEDKVPIKPSDSFFGWASSSLKLTIEEVIEARGLDQALLLEFNHMSMSLLSFLAVPLLCVMGPIHWLLGGDRSGDDHLSKLGMANVVDNHPWLYWVHGVLVWFVVVTVQRFIYRAQGRFLELRRAWLKSLPTPRSTTVLVQNIPKEHCTDKKVRAYFDNVFGTKVVESVFVVKHTEDLVALTAEKQGNESKLQAAQFQEKKTGERPTMRDYTGSTIDSIDYYTELLKTSTQTVKEEQTRVQDAVYREEPDIFTSNAFVTFKTRRDSEMALKLIYTADDDEFVCEIPPDPADVIYSDLQKDPVKQSLMTVIGYALIAFVFWSYMPAVIGIAVITDLDNLAKHFDVFKSMAESESTVMVWDAMMGSLALQLFISFVPTFFVLIFSNFFMLKAYAWLQHRIQNWYFWFNVVYVLLVTAVGSSVIATLDEIMESPTYIFYLLATTMPFATHFYLNFLPLQWVTHAQNMLRSANCFKYYAFKALLGEEVAKEKAEPEDQDYYGIGSRNARHSFLLALVLVYCSLTPLIIALGFMNFFISRVVYGYLVYWAEIRKPDLGGVFWVTNLMNVQRCMLIYIILMTGVLCFRDMDTYWPCIIAGSSFTYWYFSISRFQGAFKWECLSMEDLKDAASFTQAKKITGDGTYSQPELVQ